MIDKDIVRKARQSNLVDFFKAKGYKLERQTQGNYKVDGYGGLIIKDNMFYQFSTSKSGNAIECLTNVLGYEFKDAVSELTNDGFSNYINKDSNFCFKKEDKILKMPDKSKNCARVYAYLLKTRCLDQDIVSDLFQKKLLYQDINGNAVFVHRDENGKAIGGELQGTNTYVRFKGVVQGTKNSAFEYVKGNPEKVYLFESAIDMLSYIQMNLNEENTLYVSMAGLKKEIASKYKNKNLKVISMVDNDDAGKKFNNSLNLESNSSILEELGVKDWNELLKKNPLKKHKNSIKNKYYSL